MSDFVVSSSIAAVYRQRGFQDARFEKDVEAGEAAAAKHSAAALEAYRTGARVGVRERKRLEEASS